MVKYGQRPCQKRFGKMILTLTIQNFVLISRVCINFDRGFSVFSGETGAGKSIILDALGFIFGERADSSFIKRGSDSAVLVCELEATEEVLSLVKQQGIQVTEGTLLIKRILQKEGSSKAFINDLPISVGLLKKILGEMVEFHGQFDHLMDPSLHLKIVDQFAQVEDLKLGFRNAFLSWKEFKEELETLEQKYHQFLKDQEYFAHLYEELKKFSPRNGEEELLTKEKHLLQQGEKIYQTIELVAHAIGQRNESVDKIRRAHKSLGKLENMFTDVSLWIGEALDKLALAEDKLEEDALKLDLNPKRLNEVEDRLLEIRSLARKHNCPPDQLENVYEDLKQKIQMIQNIDENVSELKEKIITSEKEMLEKGSYLSKKRQEAASKLQNLILAELPSLKLEKSDLQIRFQTKEPTLEGLDHVEFLVDLNGTGQLSSLSKTASGGELSRLMLALKIVIAKTEISPVVIFDEIDSGMGGATAAAVATRLKGLSESSQVIAVTHSPQIAAIADHHYFVEKSGDPVSSNICLLNEDTRIIEIARMLSGDEISEEAKNAARKLMAN